MNNDINAEIEQGIREIEGERLKIDNFDRLMANLSARRFGCVQKIGKIKKRLNIAVHDPDREARQIEQHKSLAKLHNVPSEIILAPLRATIRWSKIFQKWGVGTLEELKQRRPSRQKA